MQGAGRAAPSAGSGVSASEAAPTPPPASLESYLLSSPSSSHAHPPLQPVSRLPGPSTAPCAPSPTPGPDSFRPRGSICWEEPPTPHLSIHFLARFPRSAAVPSSGKPVVVEGTRAKVLTTAFYCPLPQRPRNGFG